MAALLCEANEAAKTARAADQAALPEQVLADLLARYRELVRKGFTVNLYRRTRVAGDAVRLARRFRKFEDMILRFVTHPDIVAFTNNEAEVRHEVTRHEWTRWKEGRRMMWSAA